MRRGSNDRSLQAVCHEAVTHTRLYSATSRIRGRLIQDWACVIIEYPATNILRVSAKTNAPGTKWRMDMDAGFILALMMFQ
jgi:hypothetical protein